MSKVRWRIRLSGQAKKDIAGILTRTAGIFGGQQAAIYQTTIVEALAELEFGLDVPGSAARDEIRPNLRSLHVARNGRRGRHIVFYSAAPSRIVEVERILHDAMDFARHFPIVQS